MSVQRWLVLLMPFVFSGAIAAGAQDVTGTVCLGRNLSKVSSERTKRLYLRVDDSRPLYFVEPQSGPRVAVQGLDLDADHFVKVYFDDRLVQSWKLSFRRLEGSCVVVWRSAGAWRMDVIEESSCVAGVTEPCR